MMICNVEFLTDCGELLFGVRQAAPELAFYLGRWNVLLCLGANLVSFALPLQTLLLLHHPEALFIPLHILRNGSCVV
jgi:hypothetical protein